MTRDLSQSVCGYESPDKEAGCESWVAPLLGRPLPSSAQQYQSILHNQSELAFKLALLRRAGVVVISVPFHLRE